MDFLTKAKFKFLGQKYEFTQLKKLPQQLLESILVLERGLITGFISFAALEKIVWELSMSSSLDFEKSFVKLLTILLRRGQYSVSQGSETQLALRQLFYINAIETISIILNNLETSRLLKAICESSASQSFQKQLKKVWDAILKHNPSSPFINSINALAHQIQFQAFKCGFKFGLAKILKQSQKVSPVPAIHETGFQHFADFPKIHYLALKYGSKFFKAIKSTLYFRKDKSVPIDPFLEKLLPISLTRILLYDFDKKGRAFINLWKFFSLVGYLYKSELERKKKEEQYMQREILFRRPQFMDKVMKNFTAFFGGLFWQDFVGKFLVEFSKDNADLKNVKNLFSTHLMFRHHFAHMLKLLPKMPAELLHFLRLVFHISNEVYPYKINRNKRHSESKSRSSRPTLLDDELPRQDHIDSEDIFIRLKTGMRLDEASAEEHQKKVQRMAEIGGSPRVPKLGVMRGSASVDISGMSLDDLLGVKNSEESKEPGGILFRMESAKKVERLTGVELPLDFTDELRPVFNFFYLSFIVSHQVVALTKDENLKMKMALALMSKIIMNICYLKKFEEDDPHQLFMINTCIADWHRDLGYSTLKILEEGPGLALSKQIPEESELSRTMTQSYEEEKFRKALVSKRAEIPYSLVQLDYDVIERSLGLLKDEPQHFEELDLNNEKLLERLKDEFWENLEIRETLQNLLFLFI